MQTNETFFNMAAADVVRVCERAMAEGRPMLPELMREHARQEGLVVPPARPTPRPAAAPPPPANKFSGMTDNYVISAATHCCSPKAHKAAALAELARRGFTVSRGCVSRAFA